MIFIKVQELQIVLRVTQNLDVLIFFEERFCLMSGLKFTLSDVTSFLPNNLSELIKIIFSSGLRQSHEFSGNEQIQMVFTNEEFLEIAIKSWSEWDLNPQPLNSVQTLKPAELSRYYIIYIYIYILYIYIIYTYIYI